MPYSRCNVRTIYALVKPKKNKTTRQRIEELCSTVLFNKLRKLDPQFTDRISIINGNVQDMNLAISAIDQQLLFDNVDIVIHLAANVRFDAPLHEICLVNVRGTRETIKLARQMKKLQAFIYVSTAFSFCCNERVAEQFYEAPIDPNEMIKICEYIEMSESNIDLFSILTTKIVGKWPNTYSFSKAVAEELVRRAGADIPMALVRPSIGIINYFYITLIIYTFFFN